MQFQELMQSSLTKHVNTALKYFLRSKTDVINTTNLTLWLFIKPSGLSDATYRTKSA